MKIRYLNFLILIVISVGVLNLYSCESIINKKINDNFLKEELCKTKRYDSIIYGVKLGMTYDDFYYYMWKENIDGIFFPSRGGSMVKTNLNEGFKYPVQFEFFPNNIEGKFIPIKEYKAFVSYQTYSMYNKEMSLDNLLDQTLNYFEEGYKGNKFFKIPNNEDIFVKYNYIKIDCNRKISIVPSSALNQLNIFFEDLKPTEKKDD
ncbi:MAG: hypothetical protein CMC01_06290 [Flavobacteriaceae bacterium]|nr:hypothetical protein [Flavobacteriaceae bacterium]|tara:strand:+ start:9854 stop:10468 length:615 start_codon:yes stop_codon:yes gene_type:complete